MLDRLMKAIDRWRVIQLDTQVSGHESRCLLMWLRYRSTKRIVRANGRILGKVAKDSKLVLSGLANDACLVAVTVEDLLIVVSGRDECLNGNILALR
jgi:hypothetical protein